MSLRMRLFAMMGGLVALLVFAQWWWIRGLTRDLSAEVGEVAVWVGNHVASALVEERRAPCAGSGCSEVILTTREVARQGDAVTTGERVFVFKRQPNDGDRKPKIEIEARIEDPPTGTSGAPPPSPVVVVDRSLDAVREKLERQGFRVHMGGDDGGETAALVAIHDVEIAMIPEDHDPHLVLRFHTNHATSETIRASADRTTGPASNVRPLEHRIPIPDGGVEDKIERFSQQLLFGSAGFLGLGLVLAAAIAHRVATPMRRLSEAARRLGDGELGTQVVVVGGDAEVGQAMAAFNQMSSRLAALDAQSRALAARQHLSEIGEIARGLAHTLRNPLNALGLSVDELVAQAPSTESAQALSGTARRQIRRIDQGIRSFLTLASQGGGATEAIDVASLARDVALEASHDAGQRQVTVAVDVEGHLSPVLGVEAELRAVLQALVVNAVEASPDGSPVQIALRSEQTDEGESSNALLVEIIDRGPGLASRVRERLFTPHLSTKAHGSGMGLFLAQRIATTRYGGSLALDDRPGGGTRAVLRLFPRREEALDG